MKSEKKAKSFAEAGTRRHVVAKATFALLLPAIVLLVLRTKETAAADNKLRAYTSEEKQSDEGYVERRRRLADPPNEDVDPFIPPVIPPGSGGGQGQGQGPFNGQGQVEKKEAYVHEPELEIGLEESLVQEDQIAPPAMAPGETALDGTEDKTVEAVGVAEQEEEECLFSGSGVGCGFDEVEPITISSFDNFQQTYGPIAASETPVPAPAPAAGAKDAVVGLNYIMIKIAPQQTHPDAGSWVEHIKMYFESEQSPVLHLNGYSTGKPFPEGAFIGWWLNPYVGSINSDRWDNIILKNPSHDGILIEYIRIVHSDEVILHWYPNVWLDGDPWNPFRHLGLADKILETKLGRVDYSWINQLHYAARELGKTNGNKYGSTDNFWSNEFANWCLRKNLWGIPNPGSDVYWWQIANWFWMYDRLQFGLSNPHPGDWVKLPYGRSGLYVKTWGQWSIITIEGDSGGGAVRLRVRPKWLVQFTGNTR